MLGLTRHQTRLISKAAARVAAKERELAQLKQQRAALQRTLADLLTIPKQTEGTPDDRGD